MELGLLFTRLWMKLIENATKWRFSNVLPKMDFFENRALSFMCGRQKQKRRFCKMMMMMMTLNS